MVDTFAMMKKMNKQMKNGVGARGRGMVAALVGAVLVVGVIVAVVMVVRALGNPSTAVGGDANSGTAAPAGATGNAKPGAVDAGLEAAAKYQRDNRFPEATAILTKLSEQAATDQRVRLALAQSLLGERAYAKAYEQYQAAIALDGANVAGAQAAMAKNPKLAQLHAEAGTCALLAAGQKAVDGAAGGGNVGENGAARAIEHYSMAQTLDPTNARYPLFLGMAQLKEGTSEGDSAAMASFVRASVLQPDLAEAWGTMGELELKRNRADLAAQHVEKAMKLQPEQGKWRVVRARIFNRQGEPEKALATVAGLDAVTLNASQTLKLRGESYGLLKQPGAAAEMYEQAAKGRASAGGEPDSDLWYQAALWHQRAGNEAKAKLAAQTAMMMGNAEGKRLFESLATSGATADGSPK